MPDIVLANPRGFCAGVDRAISIVNRALELFGPPVYVRHEVVHNRYVVDSLRERGAVFVEELSEVPDDAIVIFSAHGVSKAVRREAEERGLQVFDATCPLVTKVHLEVARYRQEGRECILIGHAGHPEVEGTLGQQEGAARNDIHLVQTPEDVDRLQVRDPGHLAYTTQTTLSMDDTAQVIEALRCRFPTIVARRNDDICYATQNRQNAVKALAGECDVVLVVGSANSSNSNRLREIAAKLGVAAYLVDSAEEVDPDWLANARRIGVTAGASAPEVLVKAVVERLQELGAGPVREDGGILERVVFSLPKALQARS
ncbi:MAG: 4-hydroxy-3-methylbut-2-enyl diphosphate reductase [Gammaproteobacteria bacterium]|nr:4-hydroxy-3-methylbut-2-enyl diphosphate reductase [Gammaproteobacteria bacterium]